jgi:hypothetical protein
MCATITSYSRLYSTPVFSFCAPGEAASARDTFAVELAKCAASGFAGHCALHLSGEAAEILSGSHGRSSWACWVTPSASETEPNFEELADLLSIRVSALPFKGRTCF